MAVMPGESVRGDLGGRFGVWIAPGTLLAASATELRTQAARMERLGYGSLWTGEPPASSPAAGREIFAQSGVLLAATERLVIGTGIANITARIPSAMHAAAATLTQAYPGRFVLGLGGQSGPRALAQLRAYVDELEESAKSVLSEVDYPRVFAALGPKAHAQAVELGSGVHPFLQPVAHTAVARAALGPAPLLIPHQALVLEEDGERARGVIRTLLGPGGRDSRNPYAVNYRRLGYTDEDLADGRSDRLVDDILAWGDEPAVAARLHAHLDAGADQVLLHPLAAGLTETVDQLERLAPLLVG